MTLQLSTPSEFAAFPFPPYDIQLSLMQHLYTAIEGKKVTIIESPTGTGKTLSLLCASLTWLRDEQERARKGIISTSESGDKTKEPEWILAQTLARRQRELEYQEIEYAKRLEKARQKEAEIRKLARGRVKKKMRAIREDPRAEDLELDETQFLPEDSGGSTEDGDNISPAVRALMEKYEKVLNAHTRTQEEELACTKIYYASRTHSQLSQVLHELHKLNISLAPSSISSLHPNSFANSVPRTDGNKRNRDALDDDDDDAPAMNTRAVSLGSRKQLCVNEKLKSKSGDLDEACRQILSEKGDRRCPYLPPADDEVRMLDLRDQILATPKDIEDLVELGQDSNTCAYFGSRRAIPQAQLVLLPYNLLLQRAARESLGVDLTDQVVVIDEAHNLASTLLSLSNALLPLKTLSASLNQLNIYLTKFKNRLSTEHAAHLKRLIGLLNSLLNYANEWKATQTAPAMDRGATGTQVSGDNVLAKGAVSATDCNTRPQRRKACVEVMTSGELLRRLGRKVEGVNLLEVEQYLRKSKIARKISGYCSKALEKAAGQDPKKLAKVAQLNATSPPLHIVESFIVSLTEANDDGRVTFSLNEEGHVEIKYQHLNPATHFQDVINTARSVVLAGGTMSPISDVVAQLFCALPSERLSTFSCGHIIPPTSLQTLVLKKGPRGGELLFKYDSRGNQALIAELGQVIFNFATIAPGGMVVFVPSYSFLELVKKAWDDSGLMSKLNAKKKVFMEPQDASEVENVLREYASQIQKNNTKPAPDTKKPGALLFAVVGAKLSEGLNFTDDLARLVLIIGLPFANLASPELKERMAYVNRLEEKKGVPRAPGTKDAATELYENMCMNAVNQSIGRAIRHKGDWAALVLLDSRYSSGRIRNKLPKWIGSNVNIAETFGEAMKELGRFYREKKA